MMAYLERLSDLQKKVLRLNIDKFAGRIHKISDSRFFTDCTSYSESDKVKGIVERMIVESVMCMNHFDNWKILLQMILKIYSIKKILSYS